jgi:hypothetical protein
MRATTESDWLRRIPREDVVLVGALFALVVWRCSPSVSWQDSGSLVSAAWYLGIAHPPGEPAYLALGRLAQLMPIGDIAFRLNVLSALALSICALPLAMLAREGMREAGFAESASLSAGAVAPLLVLLGFAAQLQGVRAELYSLTAFLLIAALAAAVVLTGLRSSAAVGFFVGLGAAVHPLLTVAALPALVVARALRSGCTARDLFVGVAGCGWSFAVVAWLPLRARAVPTRAWGVPDSPGAFVDVLLARNFAANFGTEDSALAENIALLVEEWMRAGMPLLLVLAAGAALTWHRRSIVRALVVALPLWLLGNLMTMAPQNKLYANNPDVLGYLLVGCVAVAPLAAMALIGGLSRQRSLLLRGALALLLLFAILSQGFDGNQAGRTGNHLPSRFATSQAAALPAGSILLTSGNDTAFLWSYLQGVERRRSDLVVVNRVLLGHPHERNRLLGTDPQPGTKIAGTDLPWSESLRDRPLTVHRAAREQRPFFLETREIDLSSQEGPTLVRHGLVETVAGAARFVPPSPERDYLGSIRRSLFAEMSHPAFAGDVHAKLLRSYYSAIHDLGWGLDGGQRK